MIVIPAIGSFCSGGGRCVIVSIKHHSATVAKVVNPLGTVVTVQSDEDIELEPTEEIIHENCDEALFRPVVASKAIIFAETKNLQTRTPSTSSCDDKISPQTQNTEILTRKIDDSHNKISTEKCNIDKSDSLSEVDSGIEKEGSESPLLCDRISDKHTPKRIHSDQKIEFSTKPLAHSNCLKNKSFICDISDTLADMQFVPLSQPKKQPFDIITPPPLEKLEFPRRAQSPEDHLISLKTPTEEPPDQYENELLPKHVKKDKHIKNDRYQGLDQKDIISSSEENAFEEKTIAKKPRKPKTKLGTRIINIPKENDDQKDDISVDFHISLPKRSWSNVTANKASLIDASDEVAQTSDTKCMSNTPTLSYSSILKRDTIESKSSQENSLVSSEVLEPEKIQYECKMPEIHLLKLDKSSDEDKIEGSQTETTESDDSGKIPIETVAMDIEEDSQLETVKSTTSKIIKKKSKKKRR